MILRFELTMPNVGSWNGVDTGAKDNCYIFKNVPNKKADELDGKSYHYSFGDGWSANIYVKKSRRSKTSGFRGYDWMVGEILEYGDILERDKRQQMRRDGTYKR